MFDEHMLFFVPSRIGISYKVKLVRTNGLSVGPDYAEKYLHYDIDFPSSYALSNSGLPFVSPGCVT